MGSQVTKCFVVLLALGMQCVKEKGIFTIDGGDLIRSEVQWVTARISDAGKAPLHVT